MLLFYCKQFYTSLDASVWLEMLLCSWKLFYVSFNGSVRLEMLLCKWKQFNASFDVSVQLEMLLCSWKQFYASLDGSVQLEMLLNSLKQFNASFDGSVWLWMLLSSRKRFYASFDGYVLQRILFRLLAGTPFWSFPPKFEQECTEPFCVVTGDYSSHSQGQSGKRLLLASRGRKTIPSTIPNFLYWANLTPPPLGPTTPHPLPQIPPNESSIINWYDSWLK